MDHADLKPERRYDIDWLRVLAILSLHLYHTGMMYNTWGWHIQSDQTLPWLETPMSFMARWRMPLLFMISGIGVTFAFRYRSAAAFTRERARRLLIPLLFGMLVIVPPQLYLERQAAGTDYDNYWSFYQTVLEFVPYPDGSLTWNHLWFIAYLFVYAMLALPFFLALRGPGRKLLDGIRRGLAKPGALYLFILPTAIVEVALRQHWPTFQNLISDWANFSFHFVLFLAGYLVGTDQRVWTAIERQRHASLGLGMVFLILLLATDRMPYIPEMAAHSALTITWVLAILGYGKHHLNRNSRFLRYANEGIYPFYILHQTAIIIVGYPFIHATIHPLLGFTIVAVISFVASIVIYEGLIRRWNPLRLVFGLKPKPPKENESVPQDQSVQVNA